MGAMSAACGGFMFSVLMSGDRAKYGRLESVNKKDIYVVGTDPFTDLELGFSPRRMTETQWLQMKSPALLTQEAAA